jgi:hypothetical protein
MILLPDVTLASFLGGGHRTSFPIDLPTRSNHRIWLDDDLVVDRGTIVPADLR